MVNPLVFAILLIIFLPVLFVTRIVSLVSVTGAILYPFVTLIVDLCLAQAGAVRLFVRPALFGHCDLETPGQHQAAAQRHRAAHRGEKAGREQSKNA